MEDKKVRCTFCGAELTEIHSNNPQDYLHPEYEKYTDPQFTDIKPKYCCSYCSGLTAINRALYRLIHVEDSSVFMSPMRVALTLQNEADYLEKNADEIEKYYKEEVRKKIAKEERKESGNED